MSERWRSFVAVPIPDDARGTLAAAAESWRARPELEGLRWTDPDGWHITLAFLGRVPAHAAEELGAKVRRVAAGHRPLALGGDGIAAFPSPRRATVLWYGILDRDGGLERLAHDLQAALGADDGRPFRAHLTLARARGRPIDLAGFLASASVPHMAFPVDRVELMRSHLGHGPATYDVVESVPLGAAVHV